MEKFDDKVDKIALNTSVIIEEQVEFVITVTNTGNNTLHNITVTEADYEGLDFIDWKNVDANWKQSKNKFSITLRELAPKDSKKFRALFNTTKAGKLLNIANVTTDEAANKSDNDTVDVLYYNLTVVKEACNKNVKLGSNIDFNITITNTGTANINSITLIDRRL